MTQNPEDVWRHARWFEPGHPAVPDEKRYVQRGTGNTEARCLNCGEALILQHNDGEDTP